MKSAKFSEDDYPFLTNIPQHWSIVPFRRLFSESSEVNGKLPVGPMLSISGHRGVEVKSYDSENRRRTPEEVSDYRVVRPGQLAVNTMWMNHGGLGVSDLSGHMSPAYRAYNISRALLPRYAHHLLRSPGWVSGYTARVTGIRPNSLQLTRHDLMSFPVLVPPKSEQLAIADYLDHETAEIDTLIADNQELIQLFNERRAAAIHAALEADYTRFVPLKHLGSLRSGIALGSRYDGELYEFPYLRVTNVQTDHIDLHDVATVRVPRSVAVNNRLEAGDILMTEGGDRDKLGRGALWKGQIPDALHQNHIFSFRCGDELIPDYLVLVLESARARRYFDETARQSTNLASTNSRTVKAFEIPWRPVEEQARLVTALNSDMREMRTAANDSHRAIELAQERRTALISAAVTGQIDVTQKHRPVAEQLEDEVKQLS